MATLEINVPHQLPREEALKRIKNLLSVTKRDHADKISNLREAWNSYEGSFSFTAQGFDLSGTLMVNVSNIHLNAKIPFAISLFRSKISKVITEKAKELLIK